MDPRPDNQAGADIRLLRIRRRFSRLDPALRGMLWAGAAGFLFCQLNTVMRLMAQQLDPFQAQFLRYLFGVIVILPLVYRSGMAAYMPRNIGGQFGRGLVHTIGLSLWFTALPRIPLADNTAIGFTGPIFIMLGAFVFLREPMRWDRWLAALLGFTGVLIVVGPRLSGDGGFYHLVMLAASPVFAASFLITKALTRYENTGTIVVWQAITVSLFSLPMALPHWQAPSLLQWGAFLLAGVIGSVGHYFQTRSLHAAEISSTQSVRFLDLLWSAFMGWLVFADVPTVSALAGGMVIVASTLWIARREARGKPAAAIP